MLLNFDLAWITEDYVSVTHVGKALKMETERGQRQHYSRTQGKQEEKRK